MSTEPVSRFERDFIVCNIGGVCKLRCIAASVYVRLLVSILLSNDGAKLSLVFVKSPLQVAVHIGNDHQRARTF